MDAHTTKRFRRDLQRACKGKGALARVNGKRLDRYAVCPQCETVVNPVVVENVPAKFHIPERVVVQCPIIGCANVWYLMEKNGDAD